MALAMNKFVKETMAKYGTIQECFWDDEIDSVLIPDRFLDEERIWEVLCCCTEEAWEHVYKNRTKYSMRIRQMIEPADFRPEVKMVVREMTDKDMEAIAKQRDAELKREFEETVWPKMRDEIGEHEATQIDRDLDEADYNLHMAKRRMTEYLAKKSKKYVPPSARKGVVDSALLDIEKHIAECEDRRAELEKRIDELEKKLDEEKKDECFQEWLCKL